MEKMDEDTENDRTGLEWTHTEESKLWSMIENNENIENISSVLKRSKGAVITRKKKIAQILIKNGDDIYKIQKLTNLELSDLIPVKNKKKSKKQKREEKQIEINLSDYIDKIMF